MNTLGRSFAGTMLLILAACGGGGGGSSGGGSTGAPIVSLSPTSLSFNAQPLNTTSAAQTITLTNSGNASLSISSISLTGTDAAVYTKTTTCGSSLAANGNCSISITFTPTVIGSTSASVSIATNAAGSPAIVALSGSGAATNALAIVIDAGPPAIRTANIAYATVTICTPGSTSQCTSIDHIQVDTGSFGLRLFASELGTVSPTTVTDPGSGNAINECVIYADGYTWGSVGKVDIQLGSRTISNVAVQILGASSAGSVPNSCATTNGTSNGTFENTVATFGAKGILGIGVFAEDCGPYCAQSPAQPQWYYTCPAGTCSPVALALGNQIQNPLTLLTTDNNGVVIDLPAVSGSGQTTLQGTVYFGVSTQSNNTLPGTAAWYTLSLQGTLTTVYNTTTLANSFIDLGSNGLFFGDSSITACTTSIGFYCPASSLNLSATIRGLNNTQTTASFTVGNADADFTAFPNYGVYTHLAGNNSSPTAPSNAFDWGSPFFLGRPIYHLFERNSVSGVQGPAIAF
jgi:hypothetical protein